ncbi:predicted protein [Sparassis crispa]|uniref:Ribosome assembly protein 3 n=1 Tax=Sparassis crispa TaxID=139825 RepID=A0A401GTD6_9APHY|nr:predicted protein [Sparassis crispa]GBE85450.1 predicted protein [Sparassis crispa]
MAPVSAKPTVPRKRNRKRRRRAASSSSSSSDSNSDDSEPSSPKPQPKAQIPVAEPSTSEDTESESDSSLDAGDPQTDIRADKSTHGVTTIAAPPRRSPSPTPPPVAIPSFSQAISDKQNEQALRDRFRKFWMASVADTFQDDLEEIRKEPNLTTSRLSLLVDALASGADVFTSHAGNGNDINEMEVVLESEHND